MTVYRFTDEELAALWQLANKFQDVKHAHGVPDRRIAGEYSGAEIHYINLKAIHATAATLGVKYDRRVLPAGRKEPPLYISSAEQMIGVRVYARQHDLTLDEIFDAPLAVLAVPWVSAVYVDPYIENLAMVEAGWIARDMELAWCTRQVFQDHARTVLLPVRGTKLRLSARWFNLDMPAIGQQLPQAQQAGLFDE